MNINTLDLVQSSTLQGKEPIFQTTSNKHISIPSSLPNFQTEESNQQSQLYDSNVNMYYSNFDKDQDMEIESQSKQIQEQKPKGTQSNYLAIETENSERLLKRAQEVISPTLGDPENKDYQSELTNEDLGRPDRMYNRTHIASAYPFPKAKPSRANRTSSKGNYIIGETLGEGAFGLVKEATHLPTSEKVAIKILDKTRMKEEEDDFNRVKKEITILKRLRHKNIIQLYEIMESQRNLYLVMELCEGSELFDYIVKKQKLTEAEACKFFQQLIDGIEYLHVQNIVHRDLKPENLLLDSENNLKISDFGLSTRYSNTKLLSTPCGTPSYAPPEMLKGDEYHGMLSDVWSCGIILYAMICGYLPFSESCEDLNCKKIVECDYEIPSFLSRQVVDLLSHILKKDPLERYDIYEIKTHPWYNMFTPKCRPGIIIGYHKIPIDEVILNEIERLGYDKDEARRNIIGNKFDTLTAIYYLALRKCIKNGGKSISDLRSEKYLSYINNDANIYSDELNLNDDNLYEKINTDEGRPNAKDLDTNQGSRIHNDSCPILLEKDSKSSDRQIVPTGSIENNKTPGVKNTASNRTNIQTLPLEKVFHTIEYQDKFKSSNTERHEKPGNNPKRENQGASTTRRSNHQKANSIDVTSNQDRIKCIVIPLKKPENKKHTGDLNKAKKSHHTKSRDYNNTITCNEHFSDLLKIEKTNSSVKPSGTTDLENPRSQDAPNPKLDSKADNLKIASAKAKTQLNAQRLKALDVKIASKKAQWKANKAISNSIRNEAEVFKSKRKTIDRNRKRNFLEESIYRNESVDASRSITPNRSKEFVYNPKPSTHKHSNSHSYNDPQKSHRKKKAMMNTIDCIKEEDERKPVSGKYSHVKSRALRKPRLENPLQSNLPTENTVFNTSHNARLYKRNNPVNSIHKKNASCTLSSLEVKGGVSRTPYSKSNKSNAADKNRDVLSQSKSGTGRHRKDSSSTFASGTVNKQRNASSRMSMSGLSQSSSVSNSGLLKVSKLPDKMPKGPDKCNFSSAKQARRPGYQSEKQKAKAYDGPLELENILFMKFVELVSKLVDILKFKRINYIQMGSNRFKCSKSGLSFDIEVLSLLDQTAEKGAFYLKSRLNSGQGHNYKALMRLILELFGK